MPHTRSRTGCFTCREDGYKCDEQRPYCGRCLRLEKVCKGYGIRLKWRAFAPPAPAPASLSAPALRHPESAPPMTQTKRRRRSRQLASRTLSPSAEQLTSAALAAVATPSYIPPDVDTESRYLLHHWTVTLAANLSMTAGSGTRNPFLLHLTPMLFQSLALRFAISSMAASHLAILRGDDRAMEMTAARHRLRAVSSLRRTIQAEHPELSLAAILMLQLSDRLFAADTGVDHLSGAKAVIAWGQGCSSRWDDSSAAQFILSLCFYHDIMSSVARGASPLLQLPHSFPIEGLSRMQELTSVLELVGMISRLRVQTPAVADASLAPAIEHALEEAGDSSVVEQVLDDVGHTTQAYRHAAFIYLYRVWRNEGAPYPPTSENAQRCLLHLLQVPVTSPLVSAHVWPLWTAGCESIDDRNRQLVRDRVDAMFHVRHLPSLRRIKDDMEEVWKIKDAARNLTGVDNVDCVKFILANRQREADLA
ncbi:Fungal Zn binuclear cluster domain containing protein [Pleurostoma richardsiae]|uniref:Fungal Zn binuclear cluster domain containing protein n=1 Tax=Pleurostoma richardsiae TaxID=41990 RepID=A0AA38R3M8_9PEZI|nr:Fungal Zn binuclear cluster domain containing protein [Pleurostoma richardsiae]